MSSWLDRCRGLNERKSPRMNIKRTEPSPPPVANPVPRSARAASAHFWPAFKPVRRHFGPGETMGRYPQSVTRATTQPRLAAQFSGLSAGPLPLGAVELELTTILSTRAPSSRPQMVMVWRPVVLTLIVCEIQSQTFAESLKSK